MSAKNTSRANREPPAASKRGKGGHQKASGSKWIIDISQPVGDRIMDAAAFEKFLQDRIKVDKKASKPGQLGDKVKITREGDSRIVVTTTVPFSKVYLKFLTKKHLKKNGTRDFLKVTATGKQEYKLAYIDKSTADDADEE